MADKAAARPEHAQSPLTLRETIRRHDKPVDVRAICADALRRAALAPTYQDALDVAGAALSTIACSASAAQPRAGVTLSLPRGARRPELLRAVQRACLLFSLIEGMARDAGGQTLTLAKIGHSLMADVGHELELEQLGALLAGVRHG